MCTAMASMVWAVRVAGGDLSGFVAHDLDGFGAGGFRGREGGSKLLEYGTAVALVHGHSFLGAVGEGVVGFVHGRYVVDLYALVGPVGEHRFDVFDKRWYRCRCEGSAARS